MAPHSPAAALTVMFDGQVSVQAVPFTVTVNEQLAVLLDKSVAVHVTVVVPTGKLDPEGRVQLTVTLPLSSDAVGAE